MLPEMGKCAIGYIRVSTEKQIDNFSLTAQQREIEGYCDKRAFKLIEIFKDEGRSGANLERQGLSEARQFLADGQANVLVCLEADRLSRDAFDSMILRYELNQLKVELHYTKRGKVDFDDIGSQIVEDVYARISQAERKKFIQRACDGRRQAVRQGNIIVNVSPCGYKRVRQDDRTTLVIDETEVGAVRLVYKLYTEYDYSLRKIAEVLTNSEYLTRADKFPPDSKLAKLKKRKYGEWTFMQVKRILSHEVYKGQWTYNRTFSKDGIKSKNIGDPLVVEVPAIVDEIVWNLAQEKLAYNKRMVRRQPKRPYLFSGRVFCAECGRLMTGTTTDKKYRYYRCVASRKGGRVGERCTNTLSYRADIIDGEVWHWIKSLICDDEMLAVGIKAYQKRQAQDATPLLRELEACQNVLEKLRSRAGRLLDLYLDGGLEKSIYLMKKQQLEADISKGEADKARLLAQLGQKQLTPQQIETIHQYAQILRKDIETLERSGVDELKPLLKLLGVRIEVRVLPEGKQVRALCVLRPDPEEVCLLSHRC